MPPAIVAILTSQDDAAALIEAIGAPPSVWFRR